MLLAPHPQRAGTAQQQHERGGARRLIKRECAREGYGYRLEENRRAVAARLAARRERERTEVDETLALAQRLIDRDREAHERAEAAPRSEREAHAAVGSAPAAVGSAPATVGSAPAAVGSAPAAVGSAPAAVGSAPAAVGSAPAAVGSPHASVGSAPAAVGSPHASVGSLAAVGSPHAAGGLEAAEPLLPALCAPGAEPEPEPCSSVDASCLALTDQTLARRLRDVAPRRQWGPASLDLSGNLLAMLSPGLLRLQLPTLRVLELSRNHIGDEGARLLLDQLRRYRQILRLSLASNLIRGRGLELGKLVARVTSLRALDLSDNLLGLGGIARLAEALVGEPRGELAELALARNCGSETRPDAAAAREAAAQAEVLAPVLALLASPSLRRLDMSFNALGCPAMRALRGALLASPSAELCLCAEGNAPVGAQDTDAAGRIRYTTPQNE
jgi:hypothetical protein